ncbi:tyrosine-type recombinase/integrase [Mycolicibacterium rhodesiae]|jgi:integrase|uniref:Recombinase XerD n=2 Tax=Mycolicibacterium TaxID=1866885 RepID=A0A1X0IW13_MYCRH|nr:site-specific integrase [Mycolicibacterium rhodesiae]APE14982.1 recombinase XerD [Mycobacterium sp. WY10]EHB53325.1 integrase family protein [Mycolicibacterium rhodesiae JS60]MCV7343225.1 site-specific integrase [Mycolicibacterium rhodesiae]ORB53119.1 recombinase XerD [Mycolicibacterium rhodesiae]
MDDAMGRLVYLPAGASGPDPEAFLEDVLTGWRRAQLAQGTSTETIRRRNAQVLRMADFVGAFPWQWTPADADDFFGHLRGVLNRAHSTVRAYQTDVKLFLDYATNPAYDWNEHCGRLFGTVFSQVITEFNRAKHVQVDDSRAVKRPFTLDELQQFFDLADLEPERILHAGRKGALAAWRDAVAFKTLYGWGLRRNEVRHLQLVDFSRNARAPFFGDWGLVRIRHGKAMRNSPPKQRTVLTVFDWAAEAVADWVERGLPRYGQPVTDLFPTEKGGLVPERNLWQRMRDLIDELGFPAGLDLHSFRRSYATNLQTAYGYDVSFVQLQLGHEHAATTSIYTLAAPDYRARELERVLSATLTRSKADLSESRRRESR